MDDDGIGVTASINPGPLSFDGIADTQAAKDTYLIGYYAQKDLWLADKNLKEAAKRFLTGFLLWPSYYGHFLGYFFYWGVSPSKIGLSGPSLEQAQLRSNARIFLYT
jgi:hypothetical protein